MSKRRFPLKKFPELLKNPPPDVDIMLYDKKKEGSTSTGGHTVNNPNEEKMTLTKLAKIVSDGFSEVRKDIRDINARLDYNGLQIEQINKRLDYNGLKKLPD